MPETLLSNLLFVPGLVSLSVGIWLFRSGKGIEKKMSTDYTPRWTWWFTNSWHPAGVRPWPFGRYWNIKYWDQHSTRPLAFICIASGLVFTFLSLVSIFNLPIIITQKQLIWIVVFFFSIILLDAILSVIFGIVSIFVTAAKSPLTGGIALVVLLTAAYFIVRQFI